MQNKPNLLDAQMNVTSLITVDYENIANWKLGENKPNSNPIQSQSNPIKPNSRKAKMNVGFYLTRTYENNLCSRLLENKPNSKPIQSQSKPIPEKPEWM